MKSSFGGIKEMSDINRIPINMVNIDLGDELITLETALKETDTVSIGMFGSVVNKQSVERAIEYLMSHGGGRIKIPVTSEANLLTLVCLKNRAGELYVRYEYNNYRHPLNQESRPYTGEDWQVGDIVYNSDLAHSDSKSNYWYCAVSGTPGVWTSMVDSVTNGGSFNSSFDYNDSTETLTLRK